MSLQIQSRQPIHKQRPKNKFWQQAPCTRLLSVWGYIKGFFRQSGIHGLVYLTKDGLTLVEKLVWLFLVTVSIIASIHISLQSFDRYKTKSTVVGLDRDYFFWSNTIAGITVCPMQRLDMKAFDKYCLEKKVSGDQKEEFWNFLEHLANSTFSNFEDIPNSTNIDDTLTQLNITPRDYMALIYNLTLDETLMPDLERRVRTEYRKYLVFTRQVLTEWGLCYMSNTNLSLKYTAKYLIFGEVPEEYLDFMETPSPYESLTSIMEVPPVTYFEDNSVIAIMGFKESGMYFYLHSIHEVMDINKDHGFYDVTSTVSVQNMPIVTEEGFKHRTTIAQRKCRFSDESNLEHYPIYTKTMCREQCRLNLALELCGCIPHFYPNLISNPKPVCHYKTLLECFPDKKDHLIALYRRDVENIDQSDEEKEELECHCMENCIDDLLIVEAVPLPGTTGLFNGLTIMFSNVVAPVFRLKRQIIFTFTDMLVSIGGAAGLFIGFSVLGAIEIVYYFTMRLIWHLCGYKI